MLIRDHAVRGTTRRWQSNGVRPWDRAVVTVGALDDGRWWVERHQHPTIGPERSEVYATEGDALRVAQAVMAAASKLLNGREFAEVKVVGG